MTLAPQKTAIMAAAFEIWGLRAPDMLECSRLARLLAWLKAAFES